MSTTVKANLQSHGRKTVRIFREIPWLWVNYVVDRVPLPAWLLSALLSVTLFIIGSLFSLLAGEPFQFLWDLRRIIIFILPAFASYTLAYTRKSLMTIEKNMKPWIANPEKDARVFWQKAPDLLMHGFWLYVIFWLIVIPSLYLIMQHSMNQMQPQSPASTNTTITTTTTTTTTTLTPSAPLAAAPGGMGDHPRTIADMALVMTPIVAYFMGGATCVAVSGLGFMVHRMGRDLDLKEGFVLRGAGDTLLPFNRLFRMTWSTVALPLLFIGMMATTMGYTNSDTHIPFRLMDLIPVFMALAILVLAVIVPQIFINRFLRKEKAEAFQNIQQQIDEAIAIPPNATSEEIISHMHHFQSLVYMEKKVEKFRASLINTKFIIEFATVIATIISAFLSIRNFLNIFVQ